MKILLNYRTFPVAMGRYFEFALKDLGHKVITVGYNMGDEVPWPNGPHKFPKYNFGTDIRIPDDGPFPLEKITKNLSRKPDIIIQAGDSHWLYGKPPRGTKNVILATDPHAIDYTERLEYATHFACMQKYFLKDYNFKKQFWVPYAYYPGIHRRKPGFVREQDVVFCGLMYEQRDEILKGMENRGLKVATNLGLVYDEYCNFYNKGRIAFNYSSNQDLPARFWEGLAMGNLVLTNRVPDLIPVFEEYGIQEGVHYLAYDSPAEAIELACQSINNPSMWSIAENGYKVVAKHTYHQRVLSKLLWEIN